MLKALRVDRLNLLTNNLDKIARLEAHGIKVIERISLELQANPHNAGYLKTKAERIGHLLKGRG